MAYVVFNRRGLFLMQVTLGDKAKTVGRRGADISVWGPELPAIQVSLALEGESCRVIDLSGRGTLVNGKPVTEALIRDGAKITFGEYEATFLLEPPEAPYGAGETVPGPPDGPLPRELWLMSELPGDRGSRRELRLDEELTIGSAEASDLRLIAPAVSATHATVRRHKDMLLVQDRGSTNGTWYQAGRVIEVALPPGARFRIGPYDLWGMGPPEKEKGQSRTCGEMRSSATVMHTMFDEIERVAPLTMAVSIHGESGAGKELVARAIHALSDRAKGPFEGVNCANFEGAMAEGELFGHERGAFTDAVKSMKGAFLRAHGGTLFLDEVVELRKDVQAKLLRAIQEMVIRPLGSDTNIPVDVRIVTASHRRLSDEVAAGRFRADLFYRLYRVPITLPPLRDRPGEVKALWYKLLKEHHPYDGPVTSPAALAKLEAHSWPGNVRELETVLERTLCRVQGRNMINADDIPIDDFGPPAPLGNLIDTTGKSLEEIEKAAVGAVMRAVKGKRNAAVRQLDIDKKTLLRKLKDYGLEKVGLGDDPPEEE